MRDDFSEEVKRKLSGRVGNVCSNPNCRQPTSGPSEAVKAVTNVGVAAHITAASAGGPRYDSSLTQEQRSDLDNGVWLCQNCAKAVDDDPITYTEKILRDWKSSAEEAARKAIEEGPRTQQPPKDVRVIVHKAYFIGNPIEHFFIKIVNATGDADVEITHAWYENEQISVEILSAPLPKRLKPFETYETWVPVTGIPESEDCFQRFRVVASTGEVYTSRLNIDVRPLGFVAGRGTQ